MSHVTSDLYFAIIPEWVLFSDISPMAVRLYAVLARRANSTDRTCYPSRKTLANDLKVRSPRTVDGAVDELVEIGALSVTGRATDRGDQTSNLYRLVVVPPSKIVLDPSQDTARPPSQSPAHEPEPFLTKANEDNKEAIVLSLAFGFDEFWATYPRRQGKRLAMKAYQGAVLRASESEILVGAQRFAQDPNRSDQFTPHPATWLNQDRWLDDPLPAKERKISGTAMYLQSTDPFAPLELER